MRAVVFAATLLLGPAAFADPVPDPIAGPARRPLEPDDCARRTLECERNCDRMEGMNRLSCKTDCRMAESQCRNGPRR